jgi:hypothetical protein
MDLQNDHPVNGVSSCSHKQARLRCPYISDADTKPQHELPTNQTQTAAGAGAAPTGSTARLPQIDKCGPARAPDPTHTPPDPTLPYQTPSCQTLPYQTLPDPTLPHLLLPDPILPSWAILVASWAILAHPGAILAPSWVILGNPGPKKYES